MNIIDKDLNMLVVFKVVLEELSASRAAKRLNMSQPSLSHALNKLRRDFDDPLFTRKSRGLAPTPLALSLKPEVNRVLEQLERLYSADGDLVKQNWRMHDQSLRLVTSSSVVEQMLPKLVKHLAKEAANISVVAQNLQGGSPILPLVENACDLVICTHKDELPAEIHSTAIEAGRFVCLVDQNVFELNALDGESGLGNITFEQFLNHSHVVITQSEQLNHALDQGLADLGHSRKVVAGLPNFDQALEILIDSDFVLTCPERLAAAALEKHKHLKVSPCPLDIAPLSISMMWHERSHDDVMMQWVRTQLLETITKLSV